MRRSHRLWWLIYGVCVAGALSVLAWITVLVLDLEGGEHEARARSAHQRTLGDALLRMDLWFSVHLAREARRPYFEYRSFYPQERSYTRLLNRIEAGEVLIPSPLLDREFEFIRLHFQIEPDGAFTSPTVPSGNQRDLVEANAVSIDAFGRSRTALAELAAAVDLEKLRAGLAAAEAELTELLGEGSGEGSGEGPGAVAGENEREPIDGLAPEALAQIRDRGKRAKWTVKEQVAYPTPVQNFAPDTSTVDVGPLVPIWIGAEQLCFLRRVRTASSEVLQGFVCDWPRLSSILVRHVEPIVPHATLAAAPGEVAESEERGRLATIPAYLSAPAAPQALARGFTPARGTLLVSWFAALLAVSAVGVTLHASIAYGEKRSRFASAVTHELRSPLTTFRMYSEMLNKGMVQGEDKRREYLGTLQKEAERLSHLVENVLTHARLEDGRRELSRERVTGAQVFERLLPQLAPRCAEAGLELVADVEQAAGARLHTDVEVVGQVLYNLIDNACKYGRDPGDPRLHLAAQIEGEHFAIRVRDHGPGIESKRRRAIFSAFDRGGRDPAAPEPGVGLGLALARGLARDLGGELVLEAGTPGACFRFELPLSG